MRKSLSIRILSNTTVFILFVFSLHAQNHFITNPLYRSAVEQQFQKQQKLATDRSTQLFGIFNQNLTLEEREAMTFLYAYMPLSDLADYSGEFYLKNIRTTFKAKNTFSWCKAIPEDVFRHFVIPIRINNETLDTGRVVFFKELKDRIKNMSMHDAVLEVNHWCHEKVVYKGTDGRTSSPLNCVRTAFGRCGEESTFTTTALRAVGIPARQCYTPRWAHSDDNHAWVEVWVDGKWHFIGACEPETDLNIGWFAEPSKRAMLVNTNVFGNYQGPEEVLEKTEFFTKINILPNYANTKKVYVKVVNQAKQAIENANVEFCLYNYAEFYPLSNQKTDSRGVCSFLTGYGDLVVWANLNGKFAFNQVRVSQTDTMTLVLGNNAVYQKSVNYDLIPPVEMKVDLHITQEAKAENIDRLKAEAVIREAYTMTFIDSIESSALAKTIGLDNDSVCTVLHKSYGNWQTIVQFLKEKTEYNAWKLPLLYAMSEKDLRDINYSSLIDQLDFTFVYPVSNKTSKADFIDYVLNHRINIEMSSAYKQYLQNVFSLDFISKTRNDIQVLIQWIITNIRLNNAANYYNVSLSPKGVYELRVSDESSRNIFFVAVCRSFGIPARIETATKLPQYQLNGKWLNVGFEKKESIKTETGQVVLQNGTNVKDFIPHYSTHYTIAYYNGGKYRTLDYEENNSMLKFPVKLDLVVGKYMLVTGNRQRNGSVLNSISFFDVKKGQTQMVNIVLCEENKKNEIHGNVVMNNMITLNDKRILPLSSFANEKGLVLAWIDSEKEPTKHILVEMQTMKARFQNWGGNIVLLFPNEDALNSFSLDRLKVLPSQCFKAIDHQLDFLKKIETTTKLSLQSKMPILLYLSEKGDILFLSSGYAIGTVEQLEKEISKQAECLKSCVTK